MFSRSSWLPSAAALEQPTQLLFGTTATYGASVLPIVLSTFALWIEAVWQLLRVDRQYRFRPTPFVAALRVQPIFAPAIFARGAEWFVQLPAAAECAYGQAWHVIAVATRRYIDFGAQCLVCPLFGLGRFV